MKKSKLITGLSAAFVSAMALMSCSTLVKAKSGVILTIDGVQYTADMLFNDQKTPAAAEAKFNAVYKVAVRAYFKKNTGDNAEIARQVKVKINEQKATAKSNADKNGTSYDVEWEKILKENGVDTTKKLQDKFEYEFQKEKFEDHFYEDNYKYLRSGILPGTTEETFTNYFKGKQPYHMKHILVKVDGVGSDNETGTITKEQSIKLYNVITDLAKGEKSFDEISKLYSDDETAKKEHASLGIMSRDTSFVDDFKLGTYLYESFFSTATSVTDPDGLYDTLKAEDQFFPAGKGVDKAHEFAQKIKDGYTRGTKHFGIDPTTDEAIGVIPYEAAEKLGTKSNGGYADYEYEDQQELLSQAGIKKEDLKDKFLPRNVIFNKYFNKHNIMVIAPAKLPTDLGVIYGQNGAIQPNDGGADGSYRTKPDSYNCLYDTPVQGQIHYPDLTGFKRTAKNGDEIIATADSKLMKAIGTNKQVLRDDNGRIILVFRSGTGGASNDDSGYQGIHFVVIERSPFVQKEYDKETPSKSNKYFTTNDDYYTVYYPGQPGGAHPTYDETNEDKHTYANYIMNDPELKNKKDRADKVKSELKNCMSNLNTFIYDYLIEKSEIQFNDTVEATAVKDCITDWVKVTREDAKAEKARNWNNNWQNYCYSLEAKAQSREEIEVSTNHWKNKLVSEYCVRALTGEGGETRTADQLKHMFGVGGVFHE